MKKKIKEAGIFIVVCAIIFLSGWLILGRQPGVYGGRGETAGTKTAQSAQDVSAMLNLVMSNINSGDFEEGLKNINRIQKIDKTNNELHYLKGVVFYQMKRYKQAVKSLDKAIKYLPEFAPAQSVKGMALSQLGKYKAAESVLKAALAIAENEVSAVYGLVGVYIMTDNLSEALHYIEKYGSNYSAIYTRDYEKWMNALNKSKDTENVDKIKEIIEERLNKIDGN